MTTTTRNEIVVVEARDEKHPTWHAIATFNSLIPETAFELLVNEEFRLPKCTGRLVPDYVKLGLTKHCSVEAETFLEEARQDNVKVSGLTYMTTTELFDLYQSTIDIPAECPTTLEAVHALMSVYESRSLPVRAVYWCEEWEE